MVSTKGLCIELVGLSGIGKTTCFEHLKKSAFGKWNFREALFLGNEIPNEDLLDGTLHWELLQKKVEYLQKLELNGFRKIKLLNYFNQIIYSDFLIYNTEFENGFMLDEGLCHSFTRQLNEVCDEAFSRLMSGRALVFIRANDPITVVERLRKRQYETGFMVTHHIGLNDDSLKSMCIENQFYLDRLITRFQSLGLPNCVLIAEDSPEDKVARLLEFEYRVSTSNF